MTNNNGLTAACFELARTAKWKGKPVVDAEEIRDLAERFEAIAKDNVSEALEIDVALLERAVRYITETHGMPMGDDTRWFSDMLRALLEVARPNTGLSAEGQAFLHDMADGIQGSLAD